jgi:hypothetical protein
MTRGWVSPAANSVTSNPSGAFGHAPSGRLTTFGLFLAAATETVKDLFFR